MRVCIGTQALGASPVVGQSVDLPPGAARHLQVLRAQPGDRIECFDGAGRAWWAQVTAMQRQSVSVQLTAALDGAGPELPLPVHIALGMPANDRMDFVIEKATELGAASLQPLVCERSVLRLAGERADKKVAHWQAVATSAAEQCGRRVVPLVHPVRSLASFLQPPHPGSDPKAGALRLLLHPQATQTAAEGPPFGAVDGTPWPGAEPASRAVWVLSGPEGGLSTQEVALARAAGFVPVSLGGRVLRADTAPLAWLAHGALRLDARPGDGRGAGRGEPAAEPRSPSATG